MVDMNNCVFCNISNNLIINGDKDFSVINSKFPVTPRGHLLIIPKKHIEDKDFYQVGSEYIMWISYAIEVLRKRGFVDFNVGWNLGSRAGQTIKHMHCHVIGRRRGDVKDPRGGIRNIIPKKGNYLK